MQSSQDVEEIFSNKLALTKEDSSSDNSLVCVGGGGGGSLENKT